MLGAVIGDIVGSRFEFNNYRKKDFEIFHPQSFFTDDSILTIAVVKAILESKPDHSDLSDQTVYWMREIGQPYPDSGYGGNFYYWMYGPDPKPYGSFGNGSAMRVSAAGWAGNSLEEVELISDAVTQVTHNHPEGLKGARAAAQAVYLARTGSTKDEIRDFIEKNYYKLDFTIDEIRPVYQFNEICQDTVPQAIEAFLESENFEDAIRTAVSVGGDSDTLAAITGGIAEAYYGIPKDMRNQALNMLDEHLAEIVKQFESHYPESGKIEGDKTK